jgi:O-antigen/teichoic acid export membrane protein
MIKPGLDATVNTESPEELGRRMWAGTVRILLAESLVVPTGFLTAGFLTRRLGPEDFGLFTLAGTIVTWIEITITSVFARTTVKFVSEAKDWRPIGTAVLWLHLVSGGAVALVLWLLAGPIAGALGGPALGGYLRLFSLEIPFFCVGMAQRNLMVGVGDFNQRAMAGAARWIAKLALTVLLVEWGLSVHGAIGGSIGASVVFLAIGYAFVHPPLFSRFVFPPKRFWRYSIPLFLLAMTLRVYDKLDLVMLKGLGRAAAEVGFYGAAQTLALVPANVFIISFSPVLLATLGRALRAGDTSEARRISRDAMVTVLWALPFAGLIAGAAPEAVVVVFGQSFAPAAPVLGWLTFCAVALIMISVTTAILTAADKPRWTFSLTGPVVLLAVAGHVALIPRWGTVGAALVTTVFAGLSAVATVWAVHRVWGVRPPMATLGWSLLLCAGAYAVAAAWPAPGLWVFLKLAVIGLMIVFVLRRLGAPVSGSV